MINEASKPRIAIDLIEDIIAKKSIEIRKCENEQEKALLKNEYDKLILIGDEIYAGNTAYIDELIKRKGAHNHD